MIKIRPLIAVVDARLLFAAIKLALARNPAT
jgi:hypothetical protein